MIMLNMISPRNLSWKTLISSLTHLISAEHVAISCLTKCLDLLPVWRCINAVLKLISEVC